MSHLGGVLEVLGTKMRPRWAKVATTGAGAAATFAAAAVPFDPQVNDSRSQCLQAPAILKGF